LLPAQDQARLATRSASDDTSDSLVIGLVTCLHDLFLIHYYNSSRSNGIGTSYLKVFGTIAVRENNVLFDAELAVEVSGPDAAFAINAGTIVTDARDADPVRS
jgi:hypothetical protein